MLTHIKRNIKIHLLLTTMKSLTLTAMACETEQFIVTGAISHQSDGIWHCASPCVIGLLNNWDGRFLFNVTCIVLVEKVIGASPGTRRDSSRSDTLFSVFKTLVIDPDAYMQFTIKTLVIDPDAYMQFTIKMKFILVDRWSLQLNTLD